MKVREASSYALAAPVLAVRRGRRRSRRSPCSLIGEQPARRLRGDVRTTSTTADVDRSTSSTGPCRTTSPACAVAIGFKMNLFNIGVDGQYRLAALFAAAAGAARRTCRRRSTSRHPRRGHGRGRRLGRHRRRAQGDPRRERGRLHDHAQLHRHRHHALTCCPSTCARQGRRVASGDEAPAEVGPAPVAQPGRSSCSASTCRPAPCCRASSLIAILVGIVFYLLVYRTRFGFDLRATGANPRRRPGRGVNPKAMIMKTIVLCGAIAGLVGMGPLLSEIHKYGDTFPIGLGFTGIAVALLGRNHPAGIAVAALVWAGIEHGVQEACSTSASRRRSAASCRARSCCRPSSPSRSSVATARPPRCATRAAKAEAARAAGPPGGERRCDRHASRRPHRHPRSSGALDDSPAGGRPIIIAVVGLARCRSARSSPSADDLTAGDTFIAAVGAMPPDRASPRSAACIAERAGVVNIGLEGMMILGTWVAGLGRLAVGSMGRPRRRAFGGALGGLLHGVATVTFGVDHIVSGVAINLLAPGVTRFLSSQVFADAGDGSITQSPTMTGRRSGASRCRSCPAAAVRLETPDLLGWLDEQALVLHLRRRRVAPRPHGRPGLHHDPRHRAVPDLGLRALAHRRSASGCGRSARSRRPPTRSASPCTG